MSTRATYAFQSDALPTMTAYIHYDGYPQGAAEYFRAAILDNANGGTFAASFIRANERADFTASHEAHCDTEYRYTLSDSLLLTAEACDLDTGLWSCFFHGPLDVFVNEYSTGDKEQILMVNGRLTVESLVLKTVKGQLEYALKAFKSGWVGNACGSLSGASQMLDIIKGASDKATNLAFVVGTLYDTHQQKDANYMIEQLERIQPLV